MSVFDNIIGKIWLILKPPTDTWIDIALTFYSI